MAPIALTLALRAANACISPTTQAAPPMSPFMSSMLPAGLMEMPPVSKQTPLPTKATGRSPRLPPFQRMITVRPGRAEPWATPSSAPIPSFVIALTSRISTLDAELAQLARAAREFLGEQHVGRLVDEIARGDDAIDDVGVWRERFSRGSDIADRERNFGLQGGILAILLFGLVAVEFIGAQPHARCDRSRLIRFHRPVRQFRNDRHGFLAGEQFTGDRAAELEKIVVLRAFELAGADHDQARSLQPLRRQNIQRGRRSCP